MTSERIQLSPDFSISRIIKGGWQLSAGHSTTASNDPVEDMFAFAEAGVTTFDCADIYTGVEDLIGRFLSERKARLGRNDDIQVLTKFVPDYDALPTVNKVYVERIINRSLKRLGLERLDMVQFSWWTYDVPRWVEVAHWLNELRVAGKISLISGTNFNTQGTLEMVKAGIPITTMQVQYSLLDHRPEQGLIALCRKHNIKLLCYGTVAGGFFSDRWLNAPEPLPPFDNRSLVKYKLMIDEFGGWELFQQLLRVLNHIAQKHHTSLTNVAIRYILDQPQVGGAIIGARSAAHLKHNLEVFRFTLHAEDYDQIRKVISERKGPSGDVFDLERVKDGPHGSIMRYNLNQLA